MPTGEFDYSLRPYVSLMFKIGQAVLQEFETHAYHNFVYRDLYHVCNSGISDVNSNFNVYYESLDAQVPYFFYLANVCEGFCKILRTNNIHYMFTIYSETTLSIFMIPLLSIIYVNEEFSP